MKKIEIPEPTRAPVRCKCCKSLTAKLKMPRTMKGLLAWHARWLRLQTQYNSVGHVIFDETLEFSAGYPLPKIEVLRDLWKHHHRRLIGYSRRRRLVTEHEMVIRHRRFGSSVVNIADMATTRCRKTTIVPIFAR